MEKERPDEMEVAAQANEAREKEEKAEKNGCSLNKSIKIQPNETKWLSNDS